jgi:Xaa-Pro aminopeptidase
MHEKINMISILKQILDENKNNAILLNSKDPFLSEYAKEDYNLVEFFTGFTGSNGYLLLTSSKSILLTDGRYLEQAKRELGDSYEIIDLQDMHKIKLSENLNINFPALYFSIFEINIFKAKLSDDVTFTSKDIDFFKGKNKSLDFQSDLCCLNSKEAGLDIDTKLSNLLKSLDLKPNELYINADNSAISWLFNIRSIDIAFNPVICSYLIIANNKIRLFADFAGHSKLTSQISSLEIEIISKTELLSVVMQLGKFTQNVKFDPKITNYFFYDCFSESNIEYIADPLISAKAIKNKNEISNIKTTHVLDGIALTKFLYWLDKQSDKTELSELDCVQKLASFRIASTNYMGPSFPTICGFRENGAIIHYKSNEQTNLKFTQASLLLIDSGGQYHFGTTDVTRTIAIGKPSREMKKNFTLVLKGHIALSNLKFPLKNSGAALDSIARQYLWQEGLDYAHGTGHGVGYYLNVHEGPQSISSRSFSTQLKEGMVISNEPGYYKTGDYGIRIENLELITKFNKDFLKFKTLTLAPIDINLINKKLLTVVEIKWYNDYHNRIIKELGKNLSKEEISWVKKHNIK